MPGIIKEASGSLEPATRSGINETPNFTSDDQEAWAKALVPSLLRILENGKYPQDEQVDYFNWFCRWIVPAMGPSLYSDKRHKAKSIATADGSPIEWSIKWTEKKSRPTVRFTIEPSNSKSLTPSDPLNQTEFQRLMRDMGAQIPGLGLGLFEHFVAATLVTNKELEELQTRAVPPSLPGRGAWLAFDLEAGGIGVKAYVITAAKALSTGISAKDIVFDTIRKWDGGQGRYDTSINLFNDYLESLSSQGDLAPRVAMVAIDCEDSAQARIKIYFHTHARTLVQAKAAYTLNGRLEGQVVQDALAALSQLWQSLFGTTDTCVFESEREPGHCMCAVEMRPGREPETKLYLPINNTNMTDGQVCDGLKAWFGKRGHFHIADTYQDRFCNIL